MCGIAGGGTPALHVWNLAGPADGGRGAQVRSTVRAHVCLECGYTELYTAQPDQLRGARRPVPPAPILPPAPGSPEAVEQAELDALATLPILTRPTPPAPPRRRGLRQ